MKDAATNQIHHGMRAEGIPCLCYSEDAHYRHKVRRIGKKVGGNNADLWLSLCSSRLHPARNAVRPDKCGAVLCRGTLELRNSAIRFRWFSWGQKRPGLPTRVRFSPKSDKLVDDLVAGSAVYTTLEPCTTRKHPEIPCAQRLVDRKVARVVIGMPDPNPDIRGRGDLLLSEAGIEVQLFPRDLRSQVEEMNRDFIRAQKQRQTVVGLSEASYGNALANATLESDPQEFWEQRKRLPETDLLRKIWSKAYWRIWIRPSQFQRARFKDVEQCRQFILSSEVRVEGWFAYPSFLSGGTRSRQRID